MNIDDIKRLTLRGIMADDLMMQGLILKGGNALQLAYDITDRGSIDIDFSMEKDFAQQDLDRIENAFRSNLNESFNPQGHTVYDVKFKEKPKQGSIPEWKGYSLEFKIIDTELMKSFGDDMAKIRNHSITINENNSPKYTVDISAYEYVASAKKQQIEGVILYVYTPEMILIEKLRALCQSMKEYKSIVRSANQKQRARDVYDIHIIKTNFPGIEKNITKELVDNIFEAKRVPLEFLDQMEDLREHNRENWQTVLQTIGQGIELDEYDVYFDQMIETIEYIKELK